MKPVLLFGAKGASDAVEDLTKAQVKGYTRADGTYVKPHTTGRQAAAHKPTAPRANRSASQPKGAHPKTKAHMESMIVSANQDGRKFGKKSHYIGMHEQEVGGRKVGVTSHSGKEYKQSWTLDGKTVGPEKVQAHLDQHFSGKAGPTPKKAAEDNGVAHKKIVDTATYSGGEFEEHSSTTTDHHASRSIRVGTDKQKAHERAARAFADAGMKETGKDSITGAHKYESDTHTGEIFHNNDTMHVSVKKKNGTPMKKSVLLFGDGISDLVKAQVKGYTRSDGTYVKPHTTRRAAAKQKPTGPGRKPGGSDSSSNVGHQADALRSSSSDGDMDHWDNQQAAELLEAGDYDGLKLHLRNLDTAARDHILDHIHPDHWENLGFKPLNKQASIKKYEEKFGGSPGGESLGAAAERHGSSTAAFDDQKERAIDDAIRWANKEQGEYGTAWMRQNLPDYLSKKWGISSSHAKAALNERFGPE